MHDAAKYSELVFFDLEERLGDALGSHRRRGGGFVCCRGVIPNAGVLLGGGLYDHCDAVIRTLQASTASSAARLERAGADSVAG
jgi:hypothetical protein